MERSVQKEAICWVPLGLCVLAVLVTVAILIFYAPVYGPFSIPISSGSSYKSL